MSAGSIFTALGVRIWLILVQICCPLALHCSHVYQCSIILYHHQMPPGVFSFKQRLNTTGDFTNMFTGIFFSVLCIPFIVFCHNSISDKHIKLTVSIQVIHDNHAQWTVKETGPSYWSLLFSPTCADPMCFLDPMTTALCQSWLQPVSCCWVSLSFVDVLFTHGAFKACDSLV